jgi:hypothetical protein
VRKRIHMGDQYIGADSLDPCLGIEKTHHLGGFGTPTVRLHEIRTQVSQRASKGTFTYFPDFRKDLQTSMWEFGEPD